jgi:hypothetical protein
MGAIVEENNKYLYFDDYQSYIDAPDKPVRIVEFVDDDMVTMDIYYPPGKLRSRHNYVNGILMRAEYFHSNPYIETYTAIIGTGEVILTRPGGSEIERRRLERRVNDEGYLEYQLVIFSSGEAREHFFTKDTFR